MSYLYRPTPVTLWAPDTSLGSAPVMECPTFGSLPVFSLVFLLTWDYGVLPGNDQQVLRALDTGSGGLSVDLTTDGSTNLGLIYNGTYSSGAGSIFQTNDDWAQFRDELVWVFILESGPTGGLPQAFILRPFRDAEPFQANYDTRTQAAGTKTPYSPSQCSLWGKTNNVEPMIGPPYIFASWPRLLTLKDMKEIASFRFPPGATVFHMMTGDPDRSLDLSGNGHSINMQGDNLIMSSAKSDHAPSLVIPATNMRRYRKRKRTLLLTLSPISLMDSQQHDFLRVELDDDFTVDSTVVLPVYDSLWFRVISAGAGGALDPEVNSGTDSIQHHQHTNGRSTQWRYDGAKGDEIQADVTRGSQTGDVFHGLSIRHQGLAIDVDDYYRIRIEPGEPDVLSVDRFIAGSIDGGVGGNPSHTFAKAATQNWRVWCRTMADRVRIFVLANGILYTFDDTDANRIAVVGQCGIYALYEIQGDPATPSQWDNIVIRSTPLVYDDEFDYVASDSDLDGEDDWTKVFGDVNNFLQLNAANDRLDVVQQASSQSTGYYWTAPSGFPSVVIEADVYTGNSDGTSSITGLIVRHDGGTGTTAKTYRLKMSHQAAGDTRARIMYEDHAGSDEELLILPTASPPFFPVADTLYHILMWAETVDASTVRIHLVIDDKYWTVDHTAATRLTVDGRVGTRTFGDAATQGMYFDNIRIYDSPPHVLLADALDTSFARSPTTGAESFDVKLAQPGGTPVAGTHTILVRAREV